MSTVTERSCETLACREARESLFCLAEEGLVGGFAAFERMASVPFAFVGFGHGCGRLWRSDGWMRSGMVVYLQGSV